MIWTVLFHDAFDMEFAQLAEDLQDELLAHAQLLADFGPNLGGPQWIPSKDLVMPT